MTKWEDTHLFGQWEELFKSKPNILFIISDDHGYGDLSFMESQADVKTPNLDRLRNSGMYFSNGYVTAPICSPSRSGLITGNYQQRWGAEWFNNSHFAPEEFPTIPEVLKQADYQTGYFGKIHYGPDELGERSVPDQHGFDESYYGIASKSYGRLHYMKHAVDGVEKYGEETHYIGMNAMYHNGIAEDCEEHLTVEFTNRALNFMQERNEKDPFFCMLAYNAVHNFTWQLPEEELEKRGLPAYPDLDLDEIAYHDWYEGVISPNLENGRGYYLAQLEIMDQQIGRLLDYLEENQLQKDTLVIYVTDNGGSPCNFGNNDPLYGSKYSLFEGGIRVPYVVSWPGVIQSQSASAALVSTLDFLPTFAYLAGVNANEFSTDGKNLFETINDQEGHNSLYFDTGFQWSVREGDWKLRHVNDQEGKRMSDFLLEHEHADIGKTGTYLVSFENSLDESEAANQIETQGKVADHLQKSYGNWRRAINNNEY